MKTFVKNAIVLIAMLLCGMNVAHADKPFQVPYLHITDIVSQPGESEVAFLTRAGAQMHAYSVANGYETCGVVGKSATGYAIVLGTNNSHVGCIFLHAQVLPGYVDSGDVIHSHIPDNKTYLENAVDAKMAGQPNPMEPVRIKIDATNHFSAEDFREPSGYLPTTDGGLVHESGKPGTETKVAP
jgi:hypothetical protein